MHVSWRISVVFVQFERYVRSCNWCNNQKQRILATLVLPAAKVTLWALLQLFVWDSHLASLMCIIIGNFVRDILISSGIHDNGQWTVKSGQAVGSGQWTVGSGQWAMGNGQWAMGNGRWAGNIGQWTMDSEPWTVDCGPWAVGSVYWDSWPVNELKC